MQNCESLQTQDALTSILKDLYEGDHFALILFDESIVTWKDSLTKARTENVDEATIYVQQLSTRGCKRKLMASNFMPNVNFLLET